MTLVASLAGVARSLIGPTGLAGAAVTFTRTTTGAYDDVSGVVAPATVVSWPATALEVRNEQAGTRSSDSLAPTGQRVSARTFRVPGLGITPPQAGDVLTVGGVALRVTDVTSLQPDAATPVLYTVECVA